MSREIDMDDPGSWTDDDIRYLAERDRLPADMRADYQAEEPEEIPLEERANTGDANTSGITKEEHEARVAALAEDDEGEGLEAPYEEYTNDELRAELLRRGIEDLSGRKDDLVTRLEENDAEE